MPTRILVFISSFEIGGTIVSLNSLLKALDPERVSVDVFARKREGSYLDKMENCRILDENYWLTENFTGTSHLNSVKIKLVKAFKAICRSLHFDIKPYCIRKGCRQIGTERYDAIVSFQENITNEIAKYPAKRRIAWIHSDYSRFLNLCGLENENLVYEKIDNIVCVSAYGKSVFDGIYPQFSNKSVAIHNVIDVDAIKEKSLMTEDLDLLFDTSVFTIVSAGRLDPVKQFEKIPSIAKTIQGNTDKPFKWYIIGGSRGYGCVEKEIQEKVSEYGLEDCVIRLSEKQNIYPYIAKANLYVCTSLSESFPLVVNEAKALKVPIVSNAFPSVKESIREGVDGYVVTIEQIPSKVVEIMEKSFVTNSSSDGNDAALKSIYKLFEQRLN